MRIAIVGCGFVADFYLKTLPNHPHLELIGVMDRDRERAQRLGRTYSVPVYNSLEELLADPEVELVVNLTNPRSHYEITKAALEAGKHVYSEKPLAMEFDKAEELVQLAEACGLYLASAPCSVLSETAQTLWKALRNNAIGKVRLVYAELDDGLVHRMQYKTWLNPSGTRWPYKDEFEVGCTLEHAGYYVAWLTAFFGPAKSVTSYASCLIPDKQTDVPLDRNAPDFSVACIEFESGVVARLTNSIVAAHNHGLSIFGDDGILHVNDCWYYGEPVYISRRTSLALRLDRFPRLKRLLGVGARKYPLVRAANYTHRYRGQSHQMDFARGVAEVASAACEGRPSRLSARYSLHVNEIALAIQEPEEMGHPRWLKSTFEPVAPMHWAT